MMMPWDRMDTEYLAESKQWAWCDILYLVNVEWKFLILTIRQSSPCALQGPLEGQVKGAWQGPTEQSEPELLPADLPAETRLHRAVGILLRYIECAPGSPCSSGARNVSRGETFIKEPKCRSFVTEHWAQGWEVCLEKK